MTNFIKNFWDAQAIKHEQSPSASWADQYAIGLEIDNIAKNIRDGDNVLDVGCANGFATIEQALRHKIKITGVDFSDQMIHHAKERALPGEIDFQVADIRNLPFEDETFDVTYTTRVLINLPNWEDQKDGIDECIRVTKKGGIIILSEAFYEPLVLLNSLRQLKNLKPLVEHDFNRYLKKEKLESYLNDGFYFECVDFSSVYYLGSRFLRELITDVTKYEGYSNPINKYFYDLERQFSGGGFGIQQSYIIKK
jgi:ubiquinone/menaquinone biosynthesis C-methylase UbiE